MEMRRQRKSKNVWNGQPGDEPEQVQKLARIRSFLERGSVSQGTEAKYKKQVEQFLSFADDEKLALVADDEVDAAIVLQPRATCERWRGATGGASVLPTPVREVGRTKIRSVVESSEGLEKKGSDTIKTTVAKMIWSGVCWEMVRNKKSLMAIHVLMMVVT